VSRHSRESPSRNVQQRLHALEGGLIVSCQARKGNPLHGPQAMALMAQAAALGGARALRVNGVDDIRAVMHASELPVMGINKVEHDDSPVMITPTVRDAEAILETGVPFVALDGTGRRRPGGETLAGIVAVIHRHDALAFADLATRDDLAGAVAADVDAVGTTLSGYTAESEREDDAPDFDLLRWLVKHSPVPVFAEGRIWTPEQAAEALAIGASFVVVGTAITNPMAITSRFVAATQAAVQKKG
jgi:N-acylglucosamine-6-phosphate 2-epimerase